jgi:hypothetical protein
MKILCPLGSLCTAASLHFLMSLSVLSESKGHVVQTSNSTIFSIEKNVGQEISIPSLHLHNCTKDITKKTLHKT